MAADIIRVGDNGVHQVGSRTRFNPEIGIEEVLIYEGDELALRSEAQSVMNQGGEAFVYNYNGPAYRMDVIWPQDVTAAVDAWERVTEFVQEDLRENPKVISLFGTTDALTEAVFYARQAINLGQPLATVLPHATAAQQLLYEEMARGVTSHEISRIVLSRRRHIPIGWTAARTPTAVALIYTTASLVQAFALPVGIQAILPATPGFTPSGRTWGWKVRQDDSALVLSTRLTQEVIRFTFAAWSTDLLYDLV